MASHSKQLLKVHLFAYEKDLFAKNSNQCLSLVLQYCLVEKIELKTQIAQAITVNKSVSLDELFRKSASKNEI